MAGLILVFTIIAAMAVGILCGAAALHLFFQFMSRQRQEPAALAKTAPAV